MLAIIPARGGSKGLPGKNIKLLNEKPLIAYTIEAAIASKQISRVVVSTDCDSIANVSKQYGAEVPFMRPSSLAQDHSRSIDVIRYTVEELERRDKKLIQEFVLLQPTSPLRTSQHIDEAIALFYQKKAKSVISFCEEEHSIFWNKYINENRSFEEIFQGDFIKNRQELRKTYRPNGAIYVFDKEILSTEQYYSNNSYAYIMPSKDSVDIDTQEDFDYAEFIMSKYSTK